MGVQSEHIGTCMETPDIREQKQIHTATRPSSYYAPLTSGQRMEEAKHLDKKRVPLATRPGSDTLYIIKRYDTEVATYINQPGILTCYFHPYIIVIQESVGAHCRQHSHCSNQGPG